MCVKSSGHVERGIHEGVHAESVATDVEGLLYLGGDRGEVNIGSICKSLNHNELRVKR